jgi:hypothetical protein
LKKEYDFRLAIGYKFYEGDVKWNKYSLFLPVYGFFSGLSSGLIG